MTWCFDATSYSLNDVMMSHGDRRLHYSMNNCLIVRCHQNLSTSAPRKNIQQVDEIFSIALDRGWTEYFHATIEQLPRIAPYLEFLRENTHIKIHMSVAR